MRAQTSPDHSPEPAAAKASSGLYVATWAVLAAAASGYMGILLTQPDWAAPLTTQSLRTEEPKPAAPEVVAQLTGEIHTLRTTVADLQRELIEVKSTAAAKEDIEAIREDVRAAIAPPVVESSAQEPPGLEQPTPMAAAADHSVPVVINPQSTEPQLRATQTEPPEQNIVRVNPQEEAFPEENQVVLDHLGVKIVNATPIQHTQAAPDTDPAVPEDKLARAERQDAPRSVAVAPPPPPLPLKKVALLDASSANSVTSRPVETIATSPPRSALPLATGSLPPSAPSQITFGPATVTPASEAYAIHLDAGPSLEALRLRWSVLHERHRSALGDLEPRYIAGGSPTAPSYELLAGPIASLEEASRICALLRAKAVACSVGVPFEGEAL